MRRLAAYLAAALLLCLTLPAAAQDSGDRGLLERLIEDNLSGEGMSVDITGFEGALSSQATLESMTIADADGVWLTLRGAELDWSRAALLRGRLQVARLTAEEIVLARLPAGGDKGPELTDTEARPFSLPDLPVSVEIGEIRADRVELGAPVLSQAAAFSVTGALSLADGAGTARLQMLRLDEGEGEVDLDAGFDNASRELALDLSLTEAPGGLLATIAGLPGAPGVAFTLAGTAPISDYTAELALATDGQDRLTGRITTSEAPVPGGAEGTPPARRFGADLSGDLTALVEPELHPFFGDSAALRLSGQSLPDGRLEIETLTLDAAALDLTGDLSLAADGLPEAFDLSGQVGTPGGAPLRLPVSGAPTTLIFADISAQFDADQGEAWAARAQLSGLDRPDLTLDRADLSGTGTISRRGQRAVTAAIELAAQGLGLADDALSEALGEAMTGSANIGWQEGAPVRLDRLVLSGAGIDLSGNAQIDPAADGLPAEGRIAMAADRIERFSALAGRPLGGAVSADISGRAAILNRSFDVALTAEGQDLEIGEDKVDPLLQGASRLSLRAARDAEGSRIDLFEIETPEVTANASGALNSASGQFQLSAALPRPALVLPGAPGPVNLTTGIGWAAGSPISLTDLTLTAPDLRLAGSGSFDIESESQAFEARLDLSAEDLARYAVLAGRPLNGRLEARFEGNGALDPALVARFTDPEAGSLDALLTEAVPVLAEVLGRRFDIALTATGQDLALGEAQVDPLLQGASRLVLRAAHDSASTRIDEFAFTAPQASANASGALDPETGQVDLSARLADPGAFLPGVPGPAELSAGLGWTAGRPISVNGLTLTAPALRLTGTGAFDPASEAQDFEARLTLSAQELARFSALAGRRLGGGLEATLEGRGALGPRDLSLTLDGTGRDLSIGQAEADRLLAGRSTVSGDIEMRGGQIQPSRFSVDTPVLSASAAPQAPGSDTLNVDARLADLALLAPDFPGPLTARGTVTPTEGGARLALSATGPGGTTADINGTVAQRMDLSLTGRAPLGLANAFIAPRAVQGTADFDLRLQGAPTLQNLAGSITTSGARATAPTLRIALEDIGARIGLAAGRADLAVEGRLAQGGLVRVTGPITLSAPFPADLSIVLDDAVVSDPALYRTELDGTVTVAGPLTGGARIAGTIDLGETNVRVPSTGLGGGGTIPEGLDHRGEPGESRATRARAGLLQTGDGNGGGAAGPGYPLDLRINALNRIFLRGRGLDAELGGSLRIGGTTNTIVPSGRFELVRGRLDILGQRVQMTEGWVQLEGDFDPTLYLLAETETDDATIRIIVEGLASEPEIRFTSLPELPEDEVLAQLLFNRNLDDLSALQALQLANAVAVLAGKTGTPLVQRLRAGAGLDDLDVGTDAAGNTEVTAGKYISDNVYTDVTVNSEGRTEVELNLDLTDSITVRGRTTNEGESGIGVFFERDY